MVIRYSDRARYEPTIVAWYTLIPLASRRVLLGAYSQAPSREVLRRRKGGDDVLGTRQHGDQLQVALQACPI